MGNTRKEQLIENLTKMISEWEEKLIETPDGMSKEEYGEVIENLKNAIKMLEIVKGM